MKKITDMNCSTFQNLVHHDDRAAVVSNLSSNAMTRSYTFIVVLLLVWVLFLLAGCGREAHNPSPQAERPVVTVAVPLERQITDYAEFTGRVEAVDSVQVRARVNGHLVKLLFKEGTEVKKGDVLFEIDPRPYQAQLSSDLARMQQA